MSNIALTERPAHSNMGPSSAHRWMSCTASIAYNEAHGVFTTSDAAEEGTLAHFVLEVIVSNELLAPDSHQPIPDKATQEMIDEAYKVVEILKRMLRSTPNAKLYIEEKVHMGGITDAVWGTADIIIHDPVRNSLWVIDYKFGRINVDPVENEQLLWYLLGAHATLGLAGFAAWQRVAIIQPRSGQSITPWELPKNYLKDVFLPRAIKVLDDIENDNTEFVVSEDGCKYCPGRATCPALRAEVDAALSKEFGPMDVDAIAGAMKMVPLVKAWITSTEELALAALKAGKKVDGLKLVAKRTNRRWINDEKTIEYLKSLRYTLKEVTETKPLSPARMEKIMKRVEHKRGLMELVEKREGEPTVAKSSDKRKEIEVNPFKNLENENG